MAAFKEWANAEGLSLKASLERFENTRIGLDAEDYLEGILTTVATREPLLPALGGLPLALQKHIDEDLASFRDAKITPTFVFPGLDFASQDRAMVGREARRSAKILDEAWSIYDSGRGDEAVKMFGNACTYRTQHILRWLRTYLHKQNVQVYTALYAAGAQLVELHRGKFIDGIAGSAACLLFGADRVIVSFLWRNNEILWVEAKACHSKMSSPDTFADLVLLSGCARNLLPPLAEIHSDQPAERISAARAMLGRFGGDGHAVCLSLKDDEYLAGYRKAKFAIKHPVVLFPDGRVEPRDLSKAPSDIHEFTGKRLPDELYYYISRGLISTDVLNWRTHNQIFETPPLDGGHSQAYRELVRDKLVELRTQALAVISSQLHQYYPNTPVDLVFWFNDDHKQLLVKDRTDAIDKTWVVKDDVLGDSDVLSSPLASSVQLLSQPGVASKTRSERSEPGALSSPMELLANTVFRFLRDRGYIKADHSLSAWGQAVKAAYDHHPSMTEDVEEAIFMAFELLRLGALDSQQLFPTPQYSGQPLRGSDVDRANTLLISRVASLALFRHLAIGYTGPLSRHLLAYHQMAAAARTSLRGLLEMHACALLTSGDVDRNAVTARRLTDLAAMLPFTREPDLGLSLVVKSYLDELSADPAKRGDVKTWFNYVADIEADLTKAWDLWRAVNAGVQATDAVPESVRKMFRSADEWLAKKTATTNGKA